MKQLRILLLFNFIYKKDHPSHEVQFLHLLPRSYPQSHPKSMW